MACFSGAGWPFVVQPGRRIMVGIGGSTLVRRDAPGSTNGHPTRGLKPREWVAGREGLMTCQTRSLTRRSFIGAMTAGGAAAVSPTIATPAAIAAEQIALTICSYGGVYQDSQDKAYFKPYTQANPNIRILQESPESNAKLVAMVESGNVTWDLAICSPDFGMDDDAKWLEPIDYSIIDKSQFSDGFAGNYRLGSDVEAMLMAYRKDKLKEPPQRFADFFDLKGFPGRRLAYKNLHSGILQDCAPRRRGEPEPALSDRRQARAQ